MTTPMTGPSVQIGELMVPGATSLHGAKTFMLTRPRPGNAGIEIAFGLLIGETQRRVIDRLADLMVEELRDEVFAGGLEAEARFEAALKRANSVILGFLHQHGLSLPGIKLRGAFGLLTGHQLYIASRGSVRGTVAVPQTTVATLTAFTLFDEASDTVAHPKFFSSFQNGVLPSGARLFIASAELFQAVDEAFVIARFTDADASRGTRDLKNALKSSRSPVSVLTLAVPGTGAEAHPPTARPHARQEGQRPEPKANVADVGDLVSRGLRTSVKGTGSGLRRLPGLAGSGLKAIGESFAMAAHLCARAVSTVFSLFRGDDGRFRLSAALSLPGRAMDACIDGINRIPRRRLAVFVGLFVILVVLANVSIFAIRKERLVAGTKAYSSQLAAIQQLETDIESSLIYGDTDHAQALATRLDAALGALPQSTDAEKRAVAEGRASLETVHQRMRKAVTLTNLNAFASVPAGASGLALWKDGLYAFNGSASDASVIGTDGKVSAKAIKGFSGSVAHVSPAETGLLLAAQDGSLWLWKADGKDPATSYDGAHFDPAKPLLFYQGRVYDQEQGAVIRRGVLAHSLGAIIAAIPASTLGTAVTGLAIDGDIYALSADGAVQKFLRGALVTSFGRAQLDPAAARATGLVIAGNRLAFFDQASDRIIVIDAGDGSLVAQASSPALKGIQALAFSADGTQLYVLTGDGNIYKIALSTLKP